MAISLDSIKAVTKTNSFKPRIVIIGIGGAGGNAINNMVKAGLKSVEFYAINTDAQALECSIAENKIQIGSTLTQGLGAGAKPEVGKKAAEESHEDIALILQGAHMVFIAAGMGGGTGTGAAPIIAKMAKDLDILTVAIVTKPFDFEGRSRQLIAESGIKEIEANVDTLIVIPNQNLFRVANERTSFMDAFKMADDVLCNGVRSITDLITMPGLVNLDFADLKTIMKNMGKAMISSGQSSGEERAVNAAQMAIINPLLDTSSIDGAGGVVISVVGGTDMTLFEVNDAVATVKENLGEDATIIFGATFNEEYDGTVSVSVIATGIDSDSKPSVGFGTTKPKVKKQETIKKPQVTESLLANNYEQEEGEYVEDGEESEDENSETGFNESEEGYEYEEDLDEDEESDVETNEEFAEDDILDNEYDLGQIAEPTRDMLLAKINKDNSSARSFSNSEATKQKLSDISRPEKIRNEQKEEEKTDGKKKTLGGALNTILFGSNDSSKKKMKNEEVSEVRDLFSNDLLFEEKDLSSFDHFINRK